MLTLNPNTRSYFLVVPIAALLTIILHFSRFPEIPGDPGLLISTGVALHDADVEARFPIGAPEKQDISGTIRINYHTGLSPTGGSTAAFEKLGKAFDITSIERKISPDKDEWIVGLHPKTTGRAELAFRIVTRAGNSVTLQLPSVIVAATLKERLSTFVLTFLFVLLVLLAMAKGYSERRIKAAQIQKKLEDAETKAEEHPDKAKPAWDLARANLEFYFEGNRAQISHVFFIAVIAMLVGFGFVLAGVVLAFREPRITPALVAGLSGIITQFIGATFMMIYRSTMSQANQFMSVLERINTVGMAVQVLDSIPDAETKLKNETRAQLVALLLNAGAHAAATKASAKSASA